jgi:hypothetical protein
MIPPTAAVAVMYAKLVMNVSMAHATPSQIFQHPKLSLATVKPLLLITMKIIAMVAELVVRKVHAKQECA